MANERRPFSNLCAIVLLCLCAPFASLGCGSRPEPSPAVATPKAHRPKASAQKKAPPKSFQPPVTQEASPTRYTSPAAAPLPEKTLSDLVARAAAEEFQLPPIDDAKAAAAGIRKLAGKHLILYTDLPAAAEVDELPTVFDLAVPQWCAYFGVTEASVADWQVVGCLIRDKERFVGAGLLPHHVPEFPHGYQIGSQFWWYPMEGNYFPRHQMLHEGTHAFMARWLGGGGPPWYMEGMAEMLGLHAWRDGKLALGYSPKSSEEVPYWGRLKIIRDDIAANQGLLLEDVFRYDARAHLRIEPYCWSWAAAAFLDTHPLSQKAFRELKTKVADRSQEFSQAFMDRVKADWPVIREDWQLFVIHIEYGYDVARAAVVRKADPAPLPPQGAKTAIAADRGWQSTGLKVEGGKRYQLAASGRYKVAQEPKVWWCEPGGVTIRYYRGRPLGMLVAAVGDVENPATTTSSLAVAQPIGQSAIIEPASTGTLYLKINDSPAELADNAGEIQVEIRPR